MPFLLSVVLVAAVLALRLQLIESPEFAAVLSTRQVARRPVAEVFRHDFRTLLIATGAPLATVVGFSVQTPLVVHPRAACDDALSRHDLLLMPTAPMRAPPIPPAGSPREKLVVVGQRAQ